MKNLALLVIVTLFFCSCKTTLPMGSTPSKQPMPFVKLSNGSTIDAKSVIAKNNNIKADNTTYKKKEVIAYSDGKHTYGSIKKGAFAVKIYEGDLNIYQSTSSHTSTTYHSNGPAPVNYQGSSYSSGSWTTSSHSHVSKYFQKEGTDKLTYLNYKSIKKVILPKDPGFKYLQTYKRHRLTGDLVMVGGFGMFCAGSAIVGSSIMSSTGKGEGAGFAVMLGGAGAIVTGYIMNGINQLNIKRAVAKHNGLVIKD